MGHRSKIKLLMIYASKDCFYLEGGRVVRSLQQLSERWPCHIWLVGRMKFASLDVRPIWVGVGAF